MNAYPDQIKLLDAIARCMREEACIECDNIYTKASFNGGIHYNVRSSAKFYGRGLNLVSVYADQDLIAAHIARVSSPQDFFKRYGFPLYKIVDDSVTGTFNKNYHSVQIDKKYFLPLLTKKNDALIRNFFATAVSEGFSQRKLSKKARALFEKSILMKESTSTNNDAHLVQLSNKKMLQAPNGKQEPSRVTREVSVIKRGQELVDYIKSLHDFRCQLCGTRIQMKKKGYYAEVHHIKPLGSTHNGPDVLENLICVCPNHHKELDLVARRLDLPKINKQNSHVISKEYVDYHNDLYDQE